MPPNAPEQPAQQPVEYPFPRPEAQEHSQGVAHTDIPPAHPEADLQPAPEGGRKKQQVRQGGVTTAQWVQKGIQKPQGQSNQPGRRQTGGAAADHPSSLRKKPPACRGSS